MSIASMKPISFPLDFRITCEEHGELHQTTAYCEHDVQEFQQSVGKAHHAPYGANCKSTLTIELLGPPTRNQGE